MYGLLSDEKSLPSLMLVDLKEYEAKRAKIEKFLAFSAARGLVDGCSVVPNYPHPEAK